MGTLPGRFAPRNDASRANGPRSRRLSGIAGLAALLLAGPAIAGCPPPEEAPQGAIPGQFEVDLSGAATYRLPVQVVPGTAGVAPSLALTYHGGAGDGLLGMGWSVEGLSRIERVGATRAQDGAPGAVGYAASDRYALDGARLMTVEGSYHDPAARYRTEIESWQDVRGADSAGSGYAAFVVRTPDGSTHDYGASAASRVTAKGKDDVRVWAIAKTTTAVGNTIEYSYAIDDDTGTLRPTRIDYTANDAAGLKARRSVRFGYLSRPDPRRRWIGGAPVDRTRLLTTIEAWLDDTLVRRYTLTYGQGDATSRSVLLSVTECDASKRCLPATTFDYLDLDRKTIKDADAGKKSHDVAHDGAGQWFVDVDGDGRVDHVYEKDDSSEYRLRLGSADGFGEDTAAGDKEHDVAHGGDSQWFVDLNGDGRADHVYEQEDSSTYRVRLSTGRGFDDEADWGEKAHDIAQSGAAQWFVDLNGDGRTDHVYQRDGTRSYRVRLSTGKGFDDDADWGDSEHTVAHALTGQWFVDVDGDGLPDHVYEREDSSEYRVRLNLGDRFGDDTKWGEKAHDVANSGKRDHAASAPHQGLMDVNGDGLPEFVYKRSSESTFRARLNVGDKFTTEWDYAEKSKGIAHDGDSIWSADVDGNGLADLIYEEADSSQYHVMRTPGLPADRLEAVTNGLGRVDRVLYATMAQMGYTPGAPKLTTIAEPSGVSGTVQAVQGGTRLLAVEYHLQNDATRNLSAFDYRYTYAYAEAKHAFDGRGDLGFGQVTQTDHQLGGATVTTLAQDFPLTGSVTQIDRIGVDGSPDPQVKADMLLDSRSMTWTSSTPTDASVFVVQMSGQQHNVYSYGTYHHSTGSVSAYDDHGNRTLLTRLGYVNGSGDDKDPSDNVYLTASFANSTDDRWYLGVPTGTKTCADAACKTVLRESKVEVDATTLAAKSTATRVDDDGTGESRWLTTRYSYDAVGNRVKTVDPAGIEATSTFDADYQTFPTTITRTAGGLTQTVTQGFDSATGLRIQQTDLNGQVTARCVDPLSGIYLECMPAPTGQAADDDCAWAGDAVVQSKHRSGDQPGFVTKQRVDWAGKTWRETEVRIDALGRTIQSTVKASDGGDAVVVDHVWLTAKLMKSASLPNRPAEAVVAVERHYDVFGRTVRVEQPFTDSDTPTVTTWAYGPQSVTVVQADGSDDALSTRTKTAFVNGKQRVVSRTDPDGGETTFALDLLGRTQGITDPSGGTRTTTYNALDQMLSVTSPEAGTVRFTYDSAGRISSQTDAMKQRTTTDYDALGRVKRRSRYAADGTIYEQVDTGYDAGGLGGTQGRIATTRLTRSGARVLDYAYGYDQNGMPASRTITLADGTTARTDAIFDPAGRPLSATLPGGWSVALAYDALGFTASAALSDSKGKTQLSATFADFTPTGRPGTVTYGNGVVAKLGYDATWQPKTRTLTAANGDALQDLKFSWNRTQGLKSIADKRPSAGRIGPDISQAFDRTAGRLTAAKGAYGARSYVYAKGGNLESKDGVDYTYDGQQVVSGAAGGATVFTAKYDANGNQIARNDAAKWVYTYDPANRLTQVTKAGAVVSTFEYDHTTRRIGVTDADGSLTRFLAPGYTVAGDTTTWSLLVDGARIGQVRQTGSKQTVQYFHQDQVNSTILATDAQGALAAQRIMAPFGSPVADASTDPDAIEHGFDDKLTDASGLMYFGARYYDPVTGRFLTADTRLGGRLSQQDSQSRYAFGLGDPTRWGDPSGHSVFSWVNHHIAHPVEHAARKAAHAVGHAAADSARAVGHFVVEHHEALMIGLAVGLTALDVASVVLDVATGGATVELTAGLTEADEDVIGATVGEEAADGAADAAASGGDEAADGIDSASQTRDLRPDGDGGASGDADANAQQRGRFRRIDQANGGRIYVSDGPIDANDVSAIAGPEADEGRAVDIFTNVHGTPDGDIVGEPQYEWDLQSGNRFLYEDRSLMTFDRDIETFDMTRSIQAAELGGSLASSNVTILAWCYSDAFADVASYLPEASAAP